MAQHPLAGALVFLFAMVALTSCGGNESATFADPTPVVTTAAIATATASPTSTPEPSATMTPTATTTPVPTAVPTVATPTPAAPTVPPPTATTIPPTSTAVPIATATAAPTATVIPSPTPTPAPQTQSFEVAAGEEFVVVLEVDVISGYRWELEQAVDTNVALLVDESYVGPGSTNAGSRGLQLFTFRGVTNGSTVMKFWYVGPFDNPQFPADRALISVRVGSGVPACHGRFDIEAGEEFVIIFESNPSTAYAWDFREALDTDVVVMVDETYIPSRSAAPGGGGWQQFRFRGVADGKTTISFWYVRSFDDPPVPADRADYEVVVGTGIPSCDGNFEIAVGGQFDVLLGSNPSTGYTWMLRDRLDENLLKLVTTHYVPPGHQAVGDDGLQRFRFEGTGSGTTSVRFWYVRPSDDPLVPLNTARFNVTISPR